MSITSTGISKAEDEAKHQRLRSRPVGYTVTEVARMLRIGKNAAYDMIASNEIPAVRVGRLLRIPVKPFHEKFGDTIPD
jgi:excisionase family DNA binding protein